MTWGLKVARPSWTACRPGPAGEWGWGYLTWGIHRDMTVNFFVQEWGCYPPKWYVSTRNPGINFWAQMAECHITVKGLMNPPCLPNDLPSGVARSTLIKGGLFLGSQLS